jgi:urease accessory protein
MWLASPALPVGGFSYSEGLEAAVDTGRITGEAEAAAWLQDQLLLALARADLALVARAIPAWQRGDFARITELNDWVVHTRETSELRLQSEQMGRSLLEWLRNDLASTPSVPARHHACMQAAAALRPAPTWPVAFALAAALTLPRMGTAQASSALTPPEHVHEALLSYAFGWAENMVQAAIKAVPLGQSAGQRILRALVARIPEAITQAQALPDTQRQAFTPMLAILSAQHEHQYSRLFRS